MVAVALYQPDQAANVGTILRLCACLGVPAHVIEPCGFAFSDRALKRAGMDYLDQAELTGHEDWTAFRAATDGPRLVLLTTKATAPYIDFPFQAGDRLLFGSESAGVPPAVHAQADHRLTIPMRPGLRSLNLAVSVGMVLGEALRQTQAFPAGAERL